MIAILAALSMASTPVEVTVLPERVLRRGADRFFGLNLNYIRDADANRPGARPLTEALRELGVRRLRYPGGEKSDWHRWAPPPYVKPQPISIGPYAEMPGVRMDFDGFLRTVRTLRAEPYVVLAYESEARSGVKESEFLAHAVAWVKYARTRTPRVRYWEIGNENWANNTATAEQVVGVVKRFAKAIREVDPEAKIGTGGTWTGWWRPLLDGAGDDLDFLTISAYAPYEFGSFETFWKKPEHPLDSWLTDTLTVVRERRAAGKKVPEIVVAETNAKDFGTQRPWAEGNDLPRALVLFTMLGRQLREPEVSASMVWTTRWMKDDEASRVQWYTLDPQNRPLPVAWALRMWALGVHPNVVEATSSSPTLDVFACTGGRETTVFLVNRDRVAREVRLVGLQGGHWTRRTLYGRSPDDREPKLTPECPTAPELEVPPHSITVLRRRP